MSALTPCRTPSPPRLIACKSLHACLLRGSEGICAVVVCHSSMQGHAITEPARQALPTGLQRRTCRALLCSTAVFWHCTRQEQHEDDSHDGAPAVRLRRRFWAPYIDFMRYAWHALMTNEFEGRPDVLIDGQPVLEFYSVDDSKWGSIGYEFLFFAGFFVLAWLVRTHLAPLIITARASSRASLHAIGAS